MKEREENSYSEDYSTKNKDITENSVDNFRKFLEKQEYVIVHIEKLNSIYINLNISSFIQINKMIQSYPEETLYFLYKTIEYYTPRNSLHFTRSSIKSNKDANSPFSSVKLQSSKKKSINEEIFEFNNNINDNEYYHYNDNDEYLNKFTNKKSRNNNIITIGNDENIDNIKIENEMIANNVKRLKLFETTSEKDKLPKPKKYKTSADPKLVLFKWLYHFYIILSCIIFVHYITFIFSDYNYAIFYNFISILLIISLAFVGYIGIKYKYSKPPFIIFNDKYLFWVHFIILILTIFSFTGLITAGGNFKLINSQGLFGYFIFLIYIISLIIEGYYAIYYDVIIEEIKWERNNRFNNYIDNHLNIQLTDIN